MVNLPHLFAFALSKLYRVDDFNVIKNVLILKERHNTIKHWISEKPWNVKKTLNARTKNHFALLGTNFCVLIKVLVCAEH